MSDSANQQPRSQLSDPVEYFLDDLTFHGRNDRTRDAYERVLRRFELFLRQEYQLGLAEASRRECIEWIHSLRADATESTVATYASYLHRFYSYMTRVEAFDANPMALVMEELDESIEKNPRRRDISLPAMRGFVASIHHPLEQAIIVTLLKTGIRVGELSNLDVRDIYLEDQDVVSEYGRSDRGVLEQRPDSMFIAADIQRGSDVNGEERMASNKRKRDTVIPIDAELQRVLKRWLAIRPDARSPAEPLFVSTRDAWGARLTPAMARDIVTRHARRSGWYREGADAAENVTPHYFRHFFTTHLRDRTGDRGVVKYLRGDVADDIIDTYTHNWGSRIRDLYERHIYSLT